MKKLLHFLFIISICIVNHALGNAGDQMVLQNLKYTPFPLNEKQASTFFDVNDAGRRGRNSPRGGLLWEDITYNDNRVLFAMSPDFIGRRNGVLVVFLHGNQATLERDVLERQQVAAQLFSAGINAFLLAPQFAVDALDSSPGNFAQKNYFTYFIKEAATYAGRWQDSQLLAYQLKRAPIIIVSYSGGYLAAANILKNGGASDRIKGVILLDSLYGQEDVFAKWLRSNHRKSFFFSAYTEPARASNEILQNLLREDDIDFETGMPEALKKRTINFIQLNETTTHKDLLTSAWTNQPLADLLRKTKSGQ